MYRGCMYLQGASLPGRHAPPATLGQEEKLNQIIRSGQRSMIACRFTVVVADGRLDNAKSPAVML